MSAYVAPEAQTRVDEYLAAHLEASLADLGRLCAQPSVAAQGLGMAECAELTADLLREAGFRAEIMASDGFPVVYGEADGASDRTLLFYNHYDVQPAEPLDLWESPPFTMTRRDGKPLVIAPMAGGSGPMHPFVHHLGVPIANAGIGQPDSNAHAPNEHVAIDEFLRGARHIARILERMPEL